MTEIEISDDMLISAKLTIDDAAKMAGISRDKIEKAIKAGELPAINLGSATHATLRIFREPFINWLRGRLVKSVHRSVSVMKISPPPHGASKHTQWRRNREGQTQHDR